MARTTTRRRTGGTRRVSAAQVHARADVAKSLRETTVGVRLAFTWLGVRKALEPHQLRRAREVFQTAEGSLSAGKRLLNTRNPAWRKLAGVKRRLTGYFRSVSLPYPESATRLLRRDWLHDFEARMSALREEFDAAAAALDAVYPELLAEARDALGELYDHGDYPPALAEEFSVAWDYPSLEPPDYLRKLHPDVYEAEAARVAARFDEAVRLAEGAFAAELAKLVDALVKRLRPGDDGRPREVRPADVARLTEFFERFRRLNVHGSAELDALVERARATIGGAETPPAGGDARAAMAEALAGVREQLEGMVQDRPRRRIVRGPRDGAAPEPRSTGLFARGPDRLPPADNGPEADGDDDPAADGLTRDEIATASREACVAECRRLGLRAVGRVSALRRRLLAELDDREGDS